jgi:FAD dependent oxidoreductase
MNKKTAVLFCFAGLLLGVKSFAQRSLATDVLVVGGGTGGVAAAIQSARMGVKTVLVEAGPWLGGMLSAAGVSATDGNHQLPSGLWQEFREQLYKTYGSAAALQTGWVSDTQFEPHVADSIFKAMAAKERNLQIIYGYFPIAVNRHDTVITGALFASAKNDTLQVVAAITIDATEMGDLLPMAKIPYDLGMEAGVTTGENAGVQQTNDIVQDLTYVAVLKDYGAGKDCTIVKPSGYDAAEFDGSSTSYWLSKANVKPSVDAAKMLQYAGLPNQKFMLNWPLHGNDTYLNLVELSPAAREKNIALAKATTVRFIYFIQTQLGYKNLGLADDEFPTADRLALMPYYREGRRVKGLVRFTMNDIADPFNRPTALYRTGISVGDYPIDHHHKKNLAAPQHLEFYPIPSFSVPMGVMLPRFTAGLIIAEKGISVSNVVNGTTRLQPCVLLTGQAAGCLAALAVKQKTSASGVTVRDLQHHLLKNRAAILPYIDVPPAHRFFREIQELGATGILRGTGIPYKWANQTWFYPDSLVDAFAFTQHYREFDGQAFNVGKTKWLSTADAVNTIYKTARKFAETATIQTFSAHSAADFGGFVQKNWVSWGLADFDRNRPLTRAELSVLMWHTIRPFTLRQVDLDGHFK